MSVENCVSKHRVASIEALNEGFKRRGIVGASKVTTMAMCSC